MDVCVCSRPESPEAKYHAMISENFFFFYIFSNSNVKAHLLKCTHL